MPSGIWFPEFIGLLKLTRSCPDRLRMVPVRSSSTSSPRCKDATIPAYQRGVVISNAKWSLDHDRQSGVVTDGGECGEIGVNNERQNGKPLERPSRDGCGG